MKSVLISIQPKWCELIASGKKTIEVRKTRPKIETPFKCYIYKSFGKRKDSFAREIQAYFNCGKVVGEFVCDKIDEFLVFENGSVQYWNYHELDKSCLTYEELSNYIGKDKKGYGWHISDIKIYDKPKELGEFRKSCHYKLSFCIGEICEYWGYSGCENYLIRPPQSWCYVKMEK